MRMLNTHGTAKLLWCRAAPTATAKATADAAAGVSWSRIAALYKDHRNETRWKNNARAAAHFMGCACFMVLQQP